MMRSFLFLLSKAKHVLRYFVLKKIAGDFERFLARKNDDSIPSISTFK